MGFWGEQVVPRLVEVALSDRVAAPYRRRVVAGLTGHVVEVGFGSGRNLPLLPSSVTRVSAVEPNDWAWQAAAERIDGFSGAVDRIGLDGAQIALTDGSVDAALSTWSLCTVGDLPATLREIRRVLRPGGRLHFVEHELSPQPVAARLQRFLQPAWGRVAGGCHMDRRIVEAIGAAGFDVALQPDPRFAIGVAIRT